MYVNYRTVSNEKSVNAIFSYLLDKDVSAKTVCAKPLFKYGNLPG